MIRLKSITILLLVNFFIEPALNQQIQPVIIVDYVNLRPPRLVFPPETTTTTTTPTTTTPTTTYTNSTTTISPTGRHPHSKAQQ